MIAFILNESRRPTDEVEKIVEFAHDRVLGGERLKVAVRVKTRRDGSGGGQAWDRTKHGGRKWAGRTRFGISVNAVSDEYEHFGRPRASWYAKQVRDFYGIGGIERAYTEVQLLHDAGERFVGTWPIYRVDDWQEHFLHLVAHEFGHILAYSRDRKRGLGSEVQCEIMAARVLAAWRSR